MVLRFKFRGKQTDIFLQDALYSQKLMQASYDRFLLCFFPFCLADSSYVDRKALLGELKMLIQVGHHLNVVNFLGACTQESKKRPNNQYIQDETSLCVLLTFLVDLLSNKITHSYSNIVSSCQSMFHQIIDILLAALTLIDFSLSGSMHTRK